MASIRYNITSGALPITVNLKQGVSTIDSNVHTIYETGQFDNQLTGDYTLEMIDTNGCVDTREFNQGGCGYGLLYNWYAATDERNIAPSGWHVPTITELTTLITTLGGENVAGGKSKEIGTDYWNSPNSGADNSSGFNGRGHGQRSFDDGTYGAVKSIGQFWANEGSPTKGLIVRLNYDNAYFNYSNSLSLNKKAGIAIRLLKDNSIDTGTMVGNDGKVYPTVTIGTQVWLAQNLMETRYRDGSLIPEVTDNAEWAALTTGALCAYNNDWNYACLCSAPVEVEFCVEYGCLYNWWAATDARNIAPAGWHVPTIYEFQTLADAIGANGIYDGANTIGGKLKEIGFTYWNSPNTDATNEVYFNARGTGARASNGVYSNLKHTGSFWTTTDFFGYGVRAGLFSDNNSFQCPLIGIGKYIGYSLRLLKDNTTDTGTMVGNDGKVYPTVTIGTQVWMAANLAETKYRNGDLISNHGETYTDKYTDAEWAALTTEAMCYYEDTFSNVGVYEACPTTTTTTAEPTTTTTTTSP